jgi:hypothetical protein
VGNTGNARGTAPHLHFGVYRTGRGAVNPLPFVRRADAVPQPPDGPDLRGEWARLRAAGALRAQPEVASAAKHTPVLAKHTPVRVLGRQGKAVRVQTPAGQAGYLAAADLLPPQQPLRRLSLPAATELSHQPSENAPAFGSWPARTPVAVLAETNGFSLLRGPGGELGWARF